jgi:hypothetical protein
LTLLFLYGNLFCYIASYPVLVFHVTRVQDFDEGKWPTLHFLDGYITTILFTVLAFLLCLLSSADWRFWLAFALVSLILIVQLWRECLVLFPRIAVKGLRGKVSPAFGYSFSLARERGIPEQTETVTSPKLPTVEEGSGASLEDTEEEVTRVRQDLWRREFMDTYRHMREHGNSAFMFLAELELAALVYCVITRPGQPPVQQMGALGALLGIWTVPAVFVHLIGQHLERRFSRFDFRLR